MSNMILHTGARLVTEADVRTVRTPPATDTWFPVPHYRVLDRVRECLQARGYGIAKERLALARDGHRFFGVLDLAIPLANGVSLSVGVRNSTDKSFPLGFCAGNRVVVCDNLAFRAELLVKRKHTRHGEERFGEAIATATAQLAGFKEAEEERIKRLMALVLTEDEALATVVRAMELDVFSGKDVPKIVAEWRKDPTTDNWKDYGTGTEPTAWKLVNCVTTVIGRQAVTNPGVYAARTIRLNAMFGVEPITAPTIAEYVDDDTAVPDAAA